MYVGGVSILIRRDIAYCPGNGLWLYDRGWRRKVPPIQLFDLKSNANPWNIEHYGRSDSSRPVEQLEA